ncbi:hypothetical protein HJC23_010330 [Cyclotella cryptica]|uniref:Uncharacterized protein n=1 Tax=Cyclotella cryptica TaxID=29204 RepID=A0ABD3QSI2_9STRA|eukprot:CCRYP_003728-RA/>CCRYP_003728-RA protein AED:0.05 eAED:0.05 QI:247/1/1/1/1/1/3/336/339
MSSSEDDVYAWDAGDDVDDDHIDGGITGGFTRSSRKGKGATRSSLRGKRGKIPNYNDQSPSSTSEQDADDKADADGSEEVEELNEVQVVSPKTRRASPRKHRSVLESLDSQEKEKLERPKLARNAPNHSHNEGHTLSADKESTTSSTNNDETSHQNNEGINVLIPHSLLNKHQGAGRNECTILVQVDDSGDHHLDFHGQSGAVGRFEADDEGVTLDLKGYQYRGTIRPGPTAMVIALTRDGQFKVEAITDEFVTLDTDRTNMMDRLNAVVEGEMDDGYNVIDDNVNRSEKKKSAKDGEGNEDTDKGEKKRTKRQSSGRNDRKSNGGAPKKRKLSASRKK